MQGRGGIQQDGIQDGAFFTVEDFLQDREIGLDVSTLSSETGRASVRGFQRR